MAVDCNAIGTYATSNNIKIDLTQLDSFGRDGWEICGVLAYVVLLKRPIEPFEVENLPRYDAEGNLYVKVIE